MDAYESGWVEVPIAAHLNGQTVASSIVTIFAEHMLILIVFKTLSALAKAGSFYQLMEINSFDENGPITELPRLLCRQMLNHPNSKSV